MEPVNVIIGGSPCQDLSVAGKQAGLAGERSGLFMEQLRIIKEMRKTDIERGRTGKDTRPRYMVWENVPGAFSSNKGADFSIVLQETTKVACEQAPSVPIPKNGWPPAGCLTDMGGQWSIAWRVFDAQFWGVPQRRKRIALVADFGGLTAPEILFERQGVPGYIKPCGTEGKEATGHFKTGTNTTSPTGETYCIQGNCIDRADTAGCNGKGWTEGVSYTLNTIDHPAIALEHHPTDSRISIADDGIIQTLTARIGTGGGNVPIIMCSTSEQQSHSVQDIARAWATNMCRKASSLYSCFNV